jgi:hypothetical protein
VFRKDVESAYEYTAAAYRAAGAPAKFRVRLRRVPDTIRDAYPELR